MDGLIALRDDDDLSRDPYRGLMGASSPRGKAIQIIISLALGIGAFLTFCVLRPRWTGLYNARKKLKNEATGLPELPDTLFGWIMPLWRITNQQVLASAGLDAYAFLSFFKMAIKFLTATLVFSLVVIKPVHDANPEPKAHNETRHRHDKGNELLFKAPVSLFSDDHHGNSTKHTLPEYLETDYLWMYVVFAYLFSAVAIYLIIAETRKFIEIRQEYLGTQTSVTDRTIRLSGIPADLQDEQKIKELIESLNIGKVESVTICRNWKELDDAVIARMDALRRLEEAYTIHLGYRRVERNLESLPISQPPPPSPRANGMSDQEQEESGQLIDGNGQREFTPYERARPQTNIRYGFMNLHSKSVDAIDHYEEELRHADDRIKQLRQKTFQTTSLAFVTLDSVAACQMAMQAVLDPSPLQLIANQSCAPVDVVWSNTYLPRRSRMLRSWSITVLIAILTIFWSAYLVPVAYVLNTDNIREVFPQFADFLDEHKNIQSLVTAQTPVLLATLLMVLVPYLYYWLSWYQGMISQGDVELSTISKNFFFTFFNFFVVFTVLGTASEFNKFIERFDDALRDWRKVAHTLARSLEGLLDFYVNFIVLQGLGLFPFRLLEFGSVSLYPVFRMGAKTPRDYAELVQPPVFSYGFYLPTALLIFVICMVYSVLRESWQVLLAGLIYFCFGHFCYKYQLLYAMDHQQQANGRAWGMICDRIFVGLLFFQLTTTGQLLLKQAVTRSVLILPLIVATVWISIVYGRTYKPLMKFIALRSVKLGEYYERYTDQEPSAEAESTVSADSQLAPERNVWAENGADQLRYYRDTRSGPLQGLHEGSENGPRFVNPSLVAPLDGVWIADKNFRRAELSDGEQIV